MIHIYTAKKQPATDYVDACGTPPFHGGFKPYTRLYTYCCGMTRRARYCVVQCYYDGLRVWCADGRGCKDPRVIQAKQRREHLVRSRAQQKRRSREALSKRLRALRTQAIKKGLRLLSEQEVLDEVTRRRIGG